MIGGPTVLAVLLISVSAVADMNVEIRPGGRCTVTIRDERSGSERVVDKPGPASPASEYRCAIDSPPRAQPVRLAVTLPQGERPAGAEFPRLDWVERDGHWVGTASLPAAPSFVRVPRSGSAAPGRARWLDLAALAATAIAIGWSLARLR